MKVIVTEPGKAMRVEPYFERLDASSGLKLYNCPRSWEVGEEYDLPENWQGVAADSEGEEELWKCVERATRELIDGIEKIKSYNRK